MLASIVKTAKAKILYFQEFLDAIVGTFATEPRLLNPAKRGNLVGDKAGVNADHSRFQSFSGSPDATDIATVKVTRETEFGVVSHLNSFFIGLEPEERSQGPESFFASNLHLRSDAQPARLVRKRFGQENGDFRPEEHELPAKRRLEYAPPLSPPRPGQLEDLGEPLAPN